MPLRSILYPHDGSARADAVVDSLAPIVARGAEVDLGVTLLHVRDESSPAPVDLAATVRRLTALGARVEQRERVSCDPAGAIVDEARALRPGLVAMSTHGHGGREAWVRGSVAERVLRACPVPLWMVGPRRAPGAGITSILVPLDESALAARILAPLISIARTFGARMTLLFVDEESASDPPSPATQGTNERERDVRGWLAERWAELEASGIAGAIRIVRGEVAEEILRVGEPDVFDLLALSTHGRTGPGRWPLGSTTEKVLARCRLPIFLFPGRTPE